MAELPGERDSSGFTVTSSMTVDQWFSPPYDEIHTHKAIRQLAFR